MLQMKSGALPRGPMQAIGTLSSPDRPSGRNAGGLARTDASAIAVLRRITAVVETHAQPADAVLFVNAVRRFEAGAADGVTLDAALGLAARQSQRGWWTIEARQRRDLMLRALRVTHFPTMNVKAAARALVDLGLKRPELFHGYRAPRSWRQVARIISPR